MQLKTVEEQIKYQKDVQPLIEISTLYQIKNILLLLRRNINREINH